MACDLLERLREDCHPCCETALDAAAEIERLRSELAIHKRLLMARQEALQRALARIESLGGGEAPAAL